MSVSGECFCGAVRYKVDGELRDARSCHCSRCRKAFSAQASAYAEVNADEFEWLAGEELLTTYQSGRGFGLQFCSKCGSTLCGIYQGSVHGITLGCADGNPGVEIERHIYVGSKAAWEVIPDGVTAFYGQGDDDEKN
ncbi:MAG TPA: GFA family protein [Woeseiaceae bacterium]|nr:GFA family protein [Woeseiaceae bacterium]